LGISGLDPHVLGFGIFNLPKKKAEKKGLKNHPKKKVRALPFVLARWRQKKVGVEQEKVAHVILASA
jgi:hypothetical protein